MTKDQVYSTIEMCQMFDISKSTLFRWEREGKIGYVRRDEKNNRVFSRENLDKIYHLKIGKRFKQVSHLSDVDERFGQNELLALSHTKSIDKFLIGDDTGLEELKHYNYKEYMLQSSNIKRLLQFTLNTYEPYDDKFYEVIKVVYNACKKFKS